MIVTVTLNPALLVGYGVQRVTLGAANPVSQVSYRARGAGLAVARLLHTFGHEVVAAGLAGGAAGELIRADLSRAGIATQFTAIAMESRRVVQVTEAATAEVTAFAEPPAYITTEELGRFAADYRALMDEASAAVLCGSLPAGLPLEIYASLASYAAEAGVPAVIDARGSVLWHAVPRRPALACPGTPADWRAEDLLARGAQAVAEPCAGGVRVVTAAGPWRGWLAAPRAAAPGEAAWPHDALVAGFVPGVALGWSWPDTLRHAVALAAAVPPSGEVDLGRYETLLHEVQVEPPAAR